MKETLKIDTLQKAKELHKIFIEFDIRNLEQLANILCTYTLMETAVELINETKVKYDKEDKK